MSASMRSIAGLALIVLLLPPVLAQEDEAARRAHAPNVDIEVYQRIFSSEDKPLCTVSFYNTKKMVVTAHAVDLQELAPNAYAISESDPGKEGSLPWRLKRLDLSTRRVSKRVVVTAQESYPDSWSSQELALTGLPAGVYVLRAQGGGVEARTWMAISDRALISKRAPDRVLGWLVDARTGQPVAGAWVGLYDRDGKVDAKRTERDGTVVFPAPSEGDLLWMTATGGDPAFVQPSAPARAKTYQAFVYTDRPIYRPGQLVRFRGTVREMVRGEYRVPAEGSAVQVSILFGGDPVYQQDLPLNAWGSFAGEFQLGPEPPLGRYDLVTTVGRGPARSVFYKSFEVAAYRKPEFEPVVSIPQTHYLQGATIPVTISADYFFGSPVAGGKVEYKVSFEQAGDSVPQRILDAAGLGSSRSLAIEEYFTGEGRLDAAGKLVLEVPTRYGTCDRTMTVEATVSELALRPRTAVATTLITAAMFRLDVSTGYEYLVGGQVPIEVETRDYDGNAVSTAVTIEVVETKTDREGRQYEERTKIATETDGTGKARVVFKPQRPGRFEIEAWARDAAGNPVYDDDYFYAVQKREEQPYPRLSMAPDKDRYAAGETALVHTDTDQLGAWMLVTVEGDRLYDYKVHRLLAHRFDLKVPVLEEYKPFVSVHGVMVRKGEQIRDWAGLNVPHDEHKLEVIVAPGAESYQPGQQSLWTILTRTLRGQAVSAEVGVGVVDEALYAVREDETPDPFEVLWGERAERVTTDFSHAALYPGGGAQGYGGGPQPPAPEKLLRAPERETDEALAGGIRVRRRFADTAYWAPSVVTGPDGSAQVSFELPDNLTTWRATARAIARDSSAGQSVGRATVTMPLLVRTIVPRFYVAEDEGTVAAIVHNYTGEDKSVKVTLTGTGFTVQGAPEQTITVPADGKERLTWRVTAQGPDEGVLLVSADGGAGAQDAVETRVPILPSGVKNVDGYAGSSDQEVRQDIVLPAEALAGKSELVVTLSPSLAGPIFEALDYLTSYPYGCAEQTMDSFLPDVVVARTLARLNAPREKPKLLDRYVNFGLQKLIRYQHSDGGWHWWEFDDSDPYISAYVVYGLKIADEAGYVAAAAPMRRSVAYLVNALKEEKYRPARAYLLWALAYADVWERDSWNIMAEVLEDLNDNRDQLDMFSRASLGLAIHRLVEEVTEEWQPRLKEWAAQIASELESAAIVEGNATHWSAEGQAKYSWLNNDVEVTSQVLRLLVEVKPDSERIEPAVRWLMSVRRGKHWRSTKDTAAAVLALSAYLERAQELAPNYTAVVQVNGKQVASAAFSAADVFADPKTFTIAAADLKAGSNSLQIIKDGPGMVYWSARLSYLLPAAAAVPTTDAMAVERTYRLPAEDPSGACTQQPGDVVTVSLRLTVKEDLHYAMLEEPIPAGCEVIAGDDEPWGNPWDRREVWDNRLVFFFDYLPKGLHEITYVLRTESPGQYNVLPSTASLMYFPEVRGHNRLVRMRVADVTEN